MEAEAAKLKQMQEAVEQQLSTGINGKNKEVLSS